MQNPFAGKGFTLFQGLAIDLDPTLFDGATRVTGATCDTGSGKKPKDIFQVITTHN